MEFSTEYAELVKATELSNLAQQHYVRVLQSFIVAEKAVYCLGQDFDAMVRDCSMAEQECATVHTTGEYCDAPCNMDYMCPVCEPAYIARDTVRTQLDEANIVRRKLHETLNSAMAEYADAYLYYLDATVRYEHARN